MAYVAASRSREFAVRSALGAGRSRIMALVVRQGFLLTAFGLGGGASIEEKALQMAPATAAAWKGMPVLVIVLLGGFVVNFAWCLYLNLKNRTGGDYTKRGVPLLANHACSALAGAIWCSQFIFFMKT